MQTNKQKTNRQTNNFKQTYKITNYPTNEIDASKRECLKKQTKAKQATNKTQKKLANKQT